MNRLSLLSDIAGRVSKESQFDKFFTVGGAIIPTGAEDNLRAAIGSDTPKWRDSNNRNLSLISDVLKDFNVHCTVVKIEKAEPAWTAFWNAGDQLYQYLTSRTKPTPGFAKSANILKDWAFGKCLATSLGLYLKYQGRPTILDSNGFSALCLKIICDTDIQGQENREVFIGNWKHWGEITKLTPRLEIKPYIEGIEFETEQEQNLLLLPDYLAGYVHYSSDPSRIAPPVNVSKQGLANFGQALTRVVKFDLIEYPFDETFPNLTRRFTGQ
jgi:hypothetical protein